MLHVLWSLKHGRKATSEVLGEDAECVLNNALCPRQTIIKDPLIVCHVEAGAWLHHPLPQRKNVTDHKVWDGCVVSMK